MFVSPPSLRATSLDFLRECVARDERWSGLSAGVLSGGLLEELLESLSSSHQLTDNILSFDIFSSGLRMVCISDASRLSTRGLRQLRRHRLQTLRVSRLNTCSVNELIGCLGEESLRELRELSVARSSFQSTHKLCVVIGLAKLRSLRALDVSHTEFNSHGLDIIVEDLPELQQLDISGTRVTDVSSLRKCCSRLTRLSLYNLRLNTSSTLLSTELFPRLRTLDISEDRDLETHGLTDALPNTRTTDSSVLLIRHPKHFPELRSLDLSGRDHVTVTELLSFLDWKCSNDRPLIFLGLLSVSVSQDTRLLTKSEELLISGISSERQLLESLTRYRSRAPFIQKSLFHLYEHTLTYTKTRSDVIALVIQSMIANEKALGIQMASTACLYNLTKNQLGDQLHPQTLGSVVSAVLHAMKTFPNHQQLQKNALLTLCSDRVLQDVPFDRFLTVRLVLESLVQFRETAMNRMSVAIISILAAKISTKETSVLGARPLYMTALLDIVRARLQHTNDVMLKFTLSALWNLTDESPVTCHMFLAKGGLELYLRVLQSFSGDASIETKVLGLVNNIAEVSSLRARLYQCQQLIQILLLLMDSPQIDVSYFAAGIFAHLFSSQTQQQLSEDILLRLADVVLSWKAPEVEMVAYRSFLPFIPLLRCAERPAVQLWAVWAIDHVTSKNPERYCEMLRTDNGVHCLEEIMKTCPDQLSEMRVLCARTLSALLHK